MAAAARHAKLLNDLAKGGVEPQDLTVRKQYDEFKIDVTKQALKILRERIPVKILNFNQQVSINCAPGSFLHADDLKPFVPPTPAPPTEATECCVEIDASSSQAAESAALEGPVRKFRRIEEPKKVYLEQAAMHEQVVEMGQRVRQEALELIEMVGMVKLWIQLNVPRIEDGNNFGVAIQEEAIQELGRVEDAAFALCDGTKYHAARAKLISKVVKYPHVADYTQSVLETDRKEWLHLKISLIDMRNSYSMLYDLLHKNWEKVVKPRASDGNPMMM